MIAAKITFIRETGKKYRNSNPYMLHGQGSKGNKESYNKDCLGSSGVKWV